MQFGIHVFFSCGFEIRQFAMALQVSHTAMMFIDLHCKHYIFLSELLIKVIYISC